MRDKKDTLDETVETFKRTPSMPPKGESRAIDPPSREELQALGQFVRNVPELRRAWIRLASANVEHLKHMKRIERRVVWLTLFLLVQAAVVLGGIAAAVKFNQDARSYSLETRKSVDGARTALAEFLHAQGATNEALAKEIQAEASNDPIDEQKAVEAAVEAERSTLKARRVVTDKPAERAEVDRKLEQVEQRVRKLKSPPPYSGAD